MAHIVTCCTCAACRHGSDDTSAVLGLHAVASQAYVHFECVHLQCCKEVDSGVLIQGEAGPSEVHVHHGKQVLQREKTYEQVMGSASHVRNYLSLRLRTSTHAHASHANSGPTLSAILAQLSIHRKSWTRSSSAKRTSSYKAQAKRLASSRTLYSLPLPTLARKRHTQTHPRDGRTLTSTNQHASPWVHLLWYRASGAPATAEVCRRRTTGHTDGPTTHTAAGRSCTLTRAALRCLCTHRTTAFPYPPSASPAGVGLEGCCGVVLVRCHATRAFRERLGHIETADHHHLCFSNTNTLEMVHTTMPSGASPRLYIHQVARLAVWADCL